MSLTFGSLFAGIGGLDLGLERAGMECKWQVEIDDYATRVLEKHWPNVKRWRDVKTWPQPDAEQVDLICGGFPCQDISYAGKGAGLSGERSGLFFEAMRVVSEMEPRFVLLENVSALLTRGMGDVLGTLASLGFDAEWHCIPAASVGAPHIRDRIFILAYTNSNASTANGGSAFIQRPVLQEGGREKAPDGSSVGCSGACSNVSNTDSARLPQRNESRDSGAAKARINSRSELQRAFAANRRQQWKTEPAVGRVADGVPKRVDRIRGLGNAVVPQVAEFIGRQIVANF